MHENAHKTSNMSTENNILKLAHSTQTNNFASETCKKNYLKQLSSYYLPIEWNSCSIELKTAISKNIF